MKIFNTLIDTSPGKVFVSLLLSTLAGIGYALLIPILLNSFSNNSGFEVLQIEPVYFLNFEVSNYKFAGLFFFACIVILGARTLSQLVLSRVAIDTTSQLRIKYYRGIIKAPITKLDDVGSSRLIASFTTDIKSIVQGAMLLPDLLISLVTLFGMMGFLLYLNVDMFYLICKAILFGVVTFMLPMMLASKFFTKARDKVDRLQEGVKGNIYGVKELKLCQSKREGYLNDVLLSLEKEVRSVNKTAITIVRAATNYGDMISFFVIGFVTFIFINYHSITISELLAAVMILLYITGPISIVMNSLPDIITANISFVKVEKLFSEIPKEPISSEVVSLQEWQRLQFLDVAFDYETKPGSEDSHFGIGPINFSINKGEVTFIIGGNGSGKSTLGKVISGHYIPKSGSIKAGETLIDGQHLNGFRNEVSAVYSDFYLFDRLLGETTDADNTLVNNYLERLQLSHKVSLSNGRFSTLALSDGQRKRLALLICFLEDKSLYLFDEWAADQDPEFKEVFYYEILPYLKSKGKAVVVISHDDRYFDSADRVYVMENGRIRNSETNQPTKNQVAQSKNNFEQVSANSSAEPVVS